MVKIHCSCTICGFGSVGYYQEEADCTMKECPHCHVKLTVKTYEADSALFSSPSSTGKSKNGPVPTT